MKPLASLSVDLDDKWAYLRTRGDDSWRSLPSYLERAVPRILDFLASHGLTITWFIVGQDAALARNRDLLAMVAASGHEIGNHSFHHVPWLHALTEREVEYEVTAAEERIAEATGQRPCGFRGPGYSLSEATLRVLCRRGYRYDASTLPTFVGPLARAYYLATSGLSRPERRRRRALFGRFRDGLLPLRPFRWQLEGRGLVEIPVTALPGLRLPIHVSYLLWLGQVSCGLAVDYFRTALALCRLFRISPSLLLHPLDFLGHEDASDLMFFPGMGLPAERKHRLVTAVVAVYTDWFTPVTVRRHAEEAASGRLRLLASDSWHVPRRAEARPV